MDPTLIILLEILRSLATASGTGWAVFKSMEQLKRYWPSAWPKLEGDLAFYIACALSILFPVLAYGLTAIITGAPITLDGVLAAVLVGFMASQKIYRGSDEKAAQAAGAQQPVEGGAQ